MDFAKTGSSIPKISRASHNLNIYGPQGESGFEKFSGISHLVTLALRDTIKKGRTPPKGNDPKCCIGMDSQSIQPLPSPRSHAPSGTCAFVSPAVAEGARDRQ